MFTLLHIHIASHSHGFMIYSEVIVIPVQKFTTTRCLL